MVMMDTPNTGERDGIGSTGGGFDLSCVDQHKLACEYTVLVTGAVFKSTKPKLLVGCVDGKVRVFDEAYKV